MAGQSLTRHDTRCVATSLHHCWCDSLLVLRKFVVTKENVALMYHAPGRNREFNAFVLDKSYYGPYDETTCIDWTDDSK